MPLIHHAWVLFDDAFTWLHDFPLRDYLKKQYNHSSVHNHYLWTPCETLQEFTVSLIITFFSWSLSKTCQVWLLLALFFLPLSYSSWDTHIMFCLTLFPRFLLHMRPPKTCLCHFLKGCNTSFILIVLTGEQPGFSCGSIAFGCLQFSGNCFSRLGCSTAPTLSESRSWAKNEALGCSVFPAGALVANWRMRWRHQQPCAETGSNRFWEELRSSVASFSRSQRGRKCR